MKKVIIILLYVLACFTSCKDMDSVYKEFIVSNGIIYPGVAKSPTVFPGHDRVRLDWVRSNDPKVVGAMVYWNNYTDSLNVTLPANTDTVRYLIEPLPENNYTFIIKTHDAEGNRSIPVQASGSSYGAFYIAGLANRSVEKETIDDDNIWEVSWGSSTSVPGLVLTELEYVTGTGESKTLQILPDDRETVITDGAASGTPYRYRTAYMPNSMAIDTFYTDYNESTIPQLSAKIDMRKWTGKSSSVASTASGYGTQGTNGVPEKLIDGDIATFWHSQHTNPGAPGYPHWAVFDMGRANTVARVILAHRLAYPEQSFSGFIIKGSSDPDDWEQLPNYAAWRALNTAAREAFINGWGADLSGQLTMRSVGQEKQSFVISGNPSVRYIMIYMNRKGTTDHAHLAEFEAYRY
jgi:hypothetical protein